MVNLEEIQPAFDEQDVVIHLAAVADGGATWDDLLAPNIIGTYNVFEAARRAGVKRIIYASSGSTISDWERESPYDEIVKGDYNQVSENWPKLTHESITRPSGLYGCTKVWGEALARHFSDTYDISVICLRIGAVNRENRPTSPRHFSVWCSQDDIAQMFEKCIEAPDDLQFDTFFSCLGQQMELPRHISFSTSCWISTTRCCRRTSPGFMSSRKVGNIHDLALVHEF